VSGEIVRTAGGTITIVRFDPGVHAAFVFDTFEGSLFGDERKGTAGCHPYHLLRKVPGARQAVRADFKRRIQERGAILLVAVEAAEPDDFHGWLAAVPGRNEVIAAFTRYTSRRIFRVARVLASRAGVNLSAPTPVRFWTRAAERISMRPGYHLRAAVVEAEDEAARTG
jgi:hypothetical protein